MRYANVGMHVVCECARMHTRGSTHEENKGERKRAIAVRRRSNQDKFARLRIKRGDSGRTIG